MNQYSFVFNDGSKCWCKGLAQNYYYHNPLFKADSLFTVVAGRLERRSLGKLNVARTVGKRLEESIVYV